MEDTLKGFLVTVTVIGLFITAILSFIVIFPQEQGVSFNDLNSNSTYLSIQNNTLGLNVILNSSNNDAQTSLEQWDITQGQMGSNTIKQSSSSGNQKMTSNIFSTLTLMATKLFTSASPIVYVLGALGLLSTGYITYLVIQFIRSGR